MNMDGADAPKKPDNSSKPVLRRPTTRCIYIIAAITVLCIIILCTVLAVQLTAKSKDGCPKGIHCDWRSMPHSEFLKDKRCDFLCTTRPCIRSAHYALNRIDSSKDPCEDFYEFACGKYEQESIIFPQESEGIFTYQEMENEMLLKLKEIIDSVTVEPGKKGFSLRLAKKVYDDCRNTDQHTDVLNKDIWKKLFADDGMLPFPLMNQKGAMNDQKNLVKMMSTSIFYGANPFFSVYSPRDEVVNNKTQWLFRFTSSDNLEMLQSIRKASNLDDEGSALSRYFSAFEKIMIEAGVNAVEAKFVIDFMEKLEKHFIEVATKAVESNEEVYAKNNHLRYEYHNHSCQDLDHNMPHIQWCKIQAQLRDDYGLPANSNIRIELPSLADYFGAVNTVIGHILDRDVVAYIGLKFVMKYMKYMPSPLREIYYREKDLFPKSHQYWELSARWQQCVEIVSDVLWLPLEKEYLRKHVDQAKLGKVQHMVKKIKKSYISTLDKMTWLKTPLSRSDLKKMIQDLTVVFGRLDMLLSHDDAVLDDYLETGYSNSALQADVWNPLITDVLLLIRLNTKAIMSSKEEVYTLDAEPSFGLFKPYVFKDEINIPYPMLGFSMSISGRPMYAEYATVGVFVSNYISHILFIVVHTDNSNSTIQAFKRAENCLEEQSHLYKTGKRKFKVNLPDEVRPKYQLLYTLGTLGSLQAYLDYLKEEGEDKGLPGLPFTSEQLFFISSAQAQCEKFTEKGYADLPLYLISPARFRVNVPLANSEEFSKAFRCPSGSSMNPKRKCCLLGDGTLSHDCK